MARRRPRDARRSDSILDGSLHHRFVQVVTAPLAGFPVDVEPGGGKNPLPWPFPGSIRIFGANGSWQRHAATASREIGRMLRLDASQVVAHRTPERDWQHRDAIFPTIAVSDDQFGLIEVHISDSQLSAFEESKTCAVHQRCHE